MTEQEWEEIVRSLNDVDRGAQAAAELKRKATPADLTRLLALLEDESFFVREAAAWPLSDLGVTAALPQLLEALHRGAVEGHDNDGLAAAIADLVSAQPTQATEILRSVEESGQEHLRAHASWALEFCGTDRDV